MVWDRVGDAVRGGRRAGAEAAVPRLADGRGERAGSPPPAPARRAVWSRQRRLRGSTPNSCRPGALRDQAGRRRRRLLRCPRSRPGPLGPVGWRGAAPGSVAAASGRAASEDAGRRRRCPGTAPPAGAGLCPALPCGRSLSPPGPLPGSASRRHRRLHTQPAGGFLQAGLPPRPPGFATCARRVTVCNRGFCAGLLFARLPFSLLPREHATAHSCPGADRPSPPTSLGHRFSCFKLERLLFVYRF